MIAESSPAASRRRPSIWNIRSSAVVYPSTKPRIVNGSGPDMRNPKAVAIHLDRLSDESLDSTRGFGQCTVEEPVEAGRRGEKGNRDQNVHGEQEAAH